jgi:hypothetical protein
LVAREREKLLAIDGYARGNVLLLVLVAMSYEQKEVSAAAGPDGCVWHREVLGLRECQ